MIDLNQCSPGDILIGTNGETLEYVSKTPWKQYIYLDHVVKYKTIFVDGKLISNNSYGTRTNDGFVFKYNRQPGDANIVKIIKNK